MLFLRSWIEEYIDLKEFSDKQISDVITQKSSEVEEVLKHSDYFKGKVLIGRIEHTRKHPDADKLSIFDVFLGDKGKVQIISAASNVRDGLIVPVALEGAVLPFLTISSRKMRGEVSQGMCLGMSELMLETEMSPGLWELNEMIPSTEFTTDAVFGQPISRVFPEYFPEETVFDIKVLPNKISEIGHHAGIALELAVALNIPEKLKPKGQFLYNPSAFKKELEATISNLKPASQKLTLTDDTGYAKAFLTFAIDLKKPYILPHEWQKRMYLTGRNLIGGFADVTNYFLADFGQPTHIFSRDKLSSQNGDYHWKIDRIITPKPFAGLGKLKDTILPVGTPVLYPSDDPETILSIPGVSGGAGSKTDYEDLKLLLEIANFAAEDVARACFALRYRSDGSKIWSGDVNIQMLAYSVYRYAEILGQHMTISGVYHDQQHIERGDLVRYLLRLIDTHIAIDCDWEYLAKRFDGSEPEVWEDRFRTALNALGTVTGDTFYPHIFFSNVRTQNDVFEELSRFIGYDALQPHNLQLEVQKRKHKDFENIQVIKDVLREAGFSEIITRPFVSEDKLILQETLKPLKVTKAYSSLQPYIRDTLYPTLLESIRDNLLRGEKAIRVFEYNLLHQLHESGLRWFPAVGLAGVEDDPYLFTSIIQTWIRLFGGSWSVEEASVNEKQLGKAVSYVQQVGKGRITLLEVKNSVKKDYDLPLNKRMWLVQLQIPDLIQTLNILPTLRDESDYPTVQRSYSFSVAKNLRWQDIQSQLESIESDEHLQILIKPIERFAENTERDVVNISVSLKNFDHTLSGEEISSVEEQLKQKLTDLGDVIVR